MIRTRLSAALLCALALSLFAGSSASAQLLMGIGDENVSMFTNPFFTSLGVKRTRLITPYNVALGNPTTVDHWMIGAYFDNEQVVVAFNPAAGSHCPGQPCVLPTTAQYTKAFRAFHARYPTVKIFQPWNEVNSLTQPTQAHPDAVVSFYSIVKKNCPGCTVLGADLEDLTKPHQSDEVVYATQLLAAFKRAHVATPRLWGLHNYVDVNYHTSTGTKNALKVLPGQIWLTETGGIAQFILSSGKVRLKYDLTRQANSTKWMMSLALSNKRIARIYIYDFLYDVAPQRFDSSLLGQGQTPRTAYYVLTAHYKQYFQ